MMNGWAILPAVCLLFIFAQAAQAQTGGPPWKPEYKLRPDEKARLTPADVVGPDGLVYPNWTQVGIPGGIPQVAERARVRDFGGIPDDDRAPDVGRDDSAAILAAAEKVGKEGGGAVLFEKGVYYLDRPITLRHDGVVLRGAGRDQTRIVFRYSLGAAGIRWVEPWESDELFTDSTLTLHVLPAKLQQMEIFVVGKRIANRERSLHWGNTFNIGVPAARVFECVPNGDSATVTGVARYADGTVRKLDKTFRLRRQKGDPGAWRRYGTDAAIVFSGQARAAGANNIKLARDGRRGDMKLELETTDGLRPGDRVLIEGPATERWKKLTQNKCRWGTYRRNILEITAVEGKAVALNQPLRIEFPVIDGSYIVKMDLIRRCGVEDMTLEQTEDLWITTVFFNSAWECWARGVTVKKCGRFPVYARSAKRCVIQDCIFDDAWFKGGGGTAYAGWESSYDCLMVDCVTYKLRHAPCVQWAASGNVIRRSTFMDSDMQWHAGWTNENLFEQCRVVSRRGTGSYGYGAWASPPEDEAHGPNGPRNVVYNCDIQGEKTGLWMGGMNEAWMILYNRFAAANGEGVFAKTFSFDHIIRGNVFVIQSPRFPAVSLATPDCTGVEVYDNVIHGGNGKAVDGPGKPLVERNNKLLPPYDKGVPPPHDQAPAVPSIFEWQIKNVKQAAEGR